MNHITVDPNTLASVAAGHTTVADDVGAASARLGIDDLALGVVFGVIGTEFVATAQAASHRHRERVVALADESRHTADRIRAAGAEYRAADDGAGSAIAGVVIGPGGRVA